MMIKEIDINSEEGTGFSLLCTAYNLATELNLDKRQIAREMISGDYENLLIVFDIYFGHLIKLKLIKTH